MTTPSESIQTVVGRVASRVDAFRHALRKGYNIHADRHAQRIIDLVANSLTGSGTELVRAFRVAAVTPIDIHFDSKTNQIVINDETRIDCDVLASLLGWHEKTSNEIEFERIDK